MCSKPSWLNAELPLSSCAWTTAPS
jgi:hypothetical protein